MRTKVPQKTSWKELLAMMMTIALPVAMQNLLSTTGSMVDTIMLGRLGETTVGAVGLCAQFTSLMFSGLGRGCHHRRAQPHGPRRARQS